MKHFDWIKHVLEYIDLLYYIRNNKDHNIHIDCNKEQDCYYILNIILLNCIQGNYRRYKNKYRFVIWKAIYICYMSFGLKLMLSCYIEGSLIFLGSILDSEYQVSIQDYRFDISIGQLEAQPDSLKQWGYINV